MAAPRLPVLILVLPPTFIHPFASPDPRRVLEHSRVLKLAPRHYRFWPGKYLNAIRQCGKEIDCPFAAPIPFGFDERDYTPTILRSYRFATTTLLDHLMTETKLLQRLECLRNYFLLQQADFLVHFLDTAGEELQKTLQPGDGDADLRRSLSSLTPGRKHVAVSGASTGISLPRLRALLELSVRSSVAASDPFKVRAPAALFPTVVSTSQFAWLFIDLLTDLFTDL